MFVLTEAMAVVLVVFSLSPTKEGCTMSAPSKMLTKMLGATRGVLLPLIMTEIRREDIVSQRMVLKKLSLLSCLRDAAT